MSIQTTTRPTTTRLTFGGVLNSEWIKLRTLRSTLWCYVIIVALTIGFGFLLAAAYPKPEGALPHDAQQSIWLQTATLGVTFSQLVAAVLGALMITGEYGTGMIRSTFAAVPKRLPALTAKALVFGVVTFVVSLVAIVATALLVSPLLPSRGITPDFGDGHVWWALLAGAGAVALVGMLALGIGAIIRNSAGGIAASIGLVFVLPIVASILTSLINATWLRNVILFLPDQVAGRMYSYVMDADPNVTTQSDVITLDPWQGALVLVAWFVVAFVIASVLLKRRDV